MLGQARRELGTAIVRTDNGHNAASVRRIDESGKCGVEIGKVDRDSGDVGGG